MYFTRTWEICQNYLEKLTDPELVSWNFITGGNKMTHTGSVSVKRTIVEWSRETVFLAHFQ